MNLKYILILSFVLTTIIVKGQSLSKITTINTDKIGSIPSEKITIGAITYFTADDGINGRELWKSDGTVAGTQLVKDIRIGSASSGVAWLTNLNGVLLFMANDGINGYKIWKTDGTANGTTIVSPASSTAYAQSSISNFKPIVYKNFLYYIGSDATYGGNEVWKTDGTTTGTTILKDIATLPAGYVWQDVGFFTIVNNQLFFVQNKNNSGNTIGTEIQLWKTDGSSNGTIQVSNFSNFEKFKKLIKVANNLFFITEGFNSQIRLNITNSTATGTSSLEVLTAVPTATAEVGSKLLFTKSSSLSTGDELWINNGASNSQLLKNINALTSSEPNNLTTIDSTTYFIADDGINGRELWKTDGTESGTIMLKDINSGSLGSFENTTNKQLFNLNNTLYFIANDGIHGKELWKSDGTTAGTMLIKDVNLSCASNNPSNLELNQGGLFYTGTDGINGYELWKMDTVINGSATLIKDIKSINDPLASSLDNVASSIIFKNQLLFSGVSQNYGAELYATNGTILTTQILKDINTNCNSSNPNQFLTIDTALFFTASNEFGNKIWKTDGTNNGTSMVKEINPTSKYFNPNNLINSNGDLFFLANDSLGYFGLWKTSVTSNTTEKIYTLPSYYTTIGNLTNVNGLLFFSGSYDLTTPFPQTTIFTSDGTTINTKQLKSYYSVGIFSCNSLNGKFIFGMREMASSYGQELYVSDGTAVGTGILKDINKGNNTGFYAATYPLIDSNIMYFQGIDSTSDIELWKTDGTTNGTVRIKDIDTLQNSSSSPDYFTKLNGYVYFAATTSANGRELWRTDGTANGTKLVKNIASGNLSSNPSKLVKLDNYIYFFASDSGAFFNGTNYTNNVWRTDGTDTGTILFSSFGGSLGKGKDIFKNDSFLFVTGSTAIENFQIWSSKLNLANSILSGRVITFKNQSIQKANLLLSGDVNKETITNIDGSYRFNFINNGNYTIKPTKNNDITKANGVTSVDVLLTQRHILNTTKLNSAYKIIAADVDGNKTVNSVDVLRMKRLILGTDTTFTKTVGTTKTDRLWEFVDSAYVFPDTTNPFPFKDSISFTNLTSNNTNQTFIGVKLGDVNYDWNPAVARGVAVNSLQLIVKSEKLTTNNLQLTFTSTNFNNISALQYTLHFDNTKYQFVGIENNKLGIDFNTSQANATGNIAMLWTDKNAETKSFNKDEELFTIVLKPLTIDSRLLADLQLTNDIAEVEAWDNNFNRYNIILKQNVSIKDQDTKGTNQLVIYPNPTNGIVNIECAHAKQIAIIDAMGRNIKLLTVNSKKLIVDTKQFGKGIYIVQVTMPNGTIKSKKLIVD